MNKYYDESKESKEKRLSNICQHSSRSSYKSGRSFKMVSDGRMLSISKGSRFSAKSQVIIDAQDKEIARLKKLLAQAGIDFDQVYVSASRAASRAVRVQVVVAQVHVHVQYARHARYNLYVRAARAAKAARVVKVVEAVKVANVVKVVKKVAKDTEVTVPHQAQPRVGGEDAKDAKVVKVVAGVVGVQGAKVEDAKVVARLVLVNYAAPVPTAPTVPVSVKAKSKHKLKYKVKFKFK